MPKKKSVQLCVQRFRRETESVLEFCAEAERALSAAHISVAYDAAIIKLYAAFDRLIVGALTGAINNDTSVLSETTNVQFPRHLTDDVCEYIIVGSGYFDFRGRDGLIREIRKYVPEGHYLVSAIKSKAYKESLDQLCALRNFAAHDSGVSKQAALKSVGTTRMKSAGTWLKSQGRFRKLAQSLLRLSERIEQDAPY